jgi:hypothetical protein
MWRELIITDITRMSEDKVCVAGVDKKGCVIRPLLPYPNLLREADLYNGGTVIIRPRAVLNMHVAPKTECEPPHSEDYIWSNTNQVEVLRHAPDDRWKLVLERTCSASVSAIFEANLYKNKKVAPGDGIRSMGTIKPASIDKFGYYHLKMGEIETDKYRLGFTDAAGVTFTDLPITDLSLRAYIDYLRVKRRYYAKQIRSLFEEKFAQSEVWLRLGLTRPYQKSEEDRKWCYLQVTGIYTFPDYLEGKCFADFRL